MGPIRVNLYLSDLRDFLLCKWVQQSRFSLQAAREVIVLGVDIWHFKGFAAYRNLAANTSSIRDDRMVRVRPNVRSYLELLLLIIHEIKAGPIVIRHLFV